MERTELLNCAQKTVGEKGKTVSLLGDNGVEWTNGQLVYGLHGVLRPGAEKFLVQIPVNSFFDGEDGWTFIELKEEDITKITKTADGNLALKRTFRLSKEKGWQRL